MEALSLSRADSAPAHTEVQGDSAGILESEKAVAADAERLTFYELTRERLINEMNGPATERNPNELFARLLWHYQHAHPEGSRVDGTVGKRRMNLSGHRRRADRLIWIGFGSTFNPERDVPSIVVEYVLTEPRDRDQNHHCKCRDFFDAGVSEYWIFDRFARDLLVTRVEGPDGPSERVVPEDGAYETPLLPGFVMPVAPIIALAYEWKNARIKARLAAK